MRRLGFIAAVLATSGCFEFDKAFAGRCADGGFSNNDACDGGSGFGGGGFGGGSGGGGGGGGSGGGIGPVGGGPEIDPRHFMCGPSQPGGTNPPFGSDPWFFENPSGGQANDILAVWGEADNPDGGSFETVWFAGTGPTLGKIALGTISNESWRLPPSSGDPWADAPAIVGVAGHDGGVWLVGERMPALFGGCDATSFVALDAGPFDAITEDGARIFAIKSGDGRVHELGGSPRSVTSLNGFAAIHSLYVHDTRCLVSGIDVNSDPALLDCSDTGASFTLPTGVQAYGIRRLLNGRVVVASNGQVLYPLSGSIEQSPVPSQAGEWWRDVALIESGAFVCGSSGSVSSVDGPAWPNAQTGLFTAWSSPSGVAWFGGNHGSLHRFANADPVPVLPFGSYPIRALHIGSANHQFAVTYNRILARVGFRWDEVKVENDHDWTAVAEDGTGALWLIDSSGGIYRRASGSITDRLADPQVESHPLGPEFFRPRASAATQLANGEVLLGTGTVLTRGYADGSVSTEYDFATADAGVQQIVSIAEATDGSLFLVTLGTPVRVLSRQGGNWLTLQTSAQPIDDVSACPDGTVVAAGSHGYLRRFRVGSLPLDFDAGVPATGVDFGSVWCDADNTAWALTNMGSVAHFTSQTSVDVQRTGWGRRNESGNLRPSSIRGNDTTLFIAGDSEAILARPIP